MTTSVKRLQIRAQRLRIATRNIGSRIGLPDEYFLVLVSILIGGATGVFAHFFYNLIEFVREHAFGEEGLYGERIWMLIVLPTVGALLVGHLTHFFAREAKGHGVPEVMDALYRKKGEIRPRVASVKAIASALTIGSGGSAGTEGPIIQIGAAIGSGLGRVLGIGPRQRGIVVACGISAGIAAIFNAPIAGVMFALEIFLKDFSFRTFSPVVFSSVISCSVLHAIRAEDEAIFEVSVLRDVNYVFVGYEFPLYLILGILCAVAAVGFIRALYYTEDLTDRIAIPGQLKPALGAIGLGITGALFVYLTSNPEMPAFFGNGYPAIEATLGFRLLHMSVSGLLILFVLKALATCLTLGTGGSGGVFAPSLMLGATLGGAFGLGLAKLGVIDPSGASAYALVGMAAMVAGTTHAPLTAIVMLYEITREPKVVLPVMFAAIIAVAGARLLLRESIYTLKLARRGVRTGSVTDLTILRRITVDEVERQIARFVHAADPLQRLIDLASQTDRHAGSTGAVDFVVVDDDDVYQGMVTGRDVHTALLQPEAVSLLVVGELIHSAVPTVSPNDTLDLVFDKFATNDVEALPVADPNDETRVTGLITQRAALRRYHAEIDRQTR